MDALQAKFERLELQLRAEFAQLEKDLIIVLEKQKPKKTSRKRKREPGF